MLKSSWNVMAQGDARDRKWRGNWWMKWVASTLHTISEHGVSSITTADAHSSAASSWLNWLPPSPDLNGLVRFAERRNLVSAHVPSHFKRSLQCFKHPTTHSICINTVTHTTLVSSIYSRLHISALWVFIGPFINFDTRKNIYCIRLRSPLLQ